MKKYSIKTLLFVTVIAALVVSQFVLVGQLKQARREVETARYKPGHLNIEDPSLTYVRAITGVHHQLPQSVRIVVPAGSRYLLHLSDAIFDDAAPLETLPIAETIALNAWREGADKALTYEVVPKPSVSVVKVYGGDDFCLTYSFDGQLGRTQPDEGSFAYEQQRGFKPDEMIPIARWRDSKSGRGVVVWLEPKPRSVQRESSRYSFVKRIPER